MKASFSLLVACVVLGGAGLTQAGVLNVNGASLDDLLGGGVTQVGSTMVTDVNGGSLYASITSAAFTGDNGLYAYVYQLENTGNTGSSSIDAYTVYPFWGATDNTQVGYLTSVDGLTDFAAGGDLPYEIAYLDLPVNGPIVTFYYPKDEGLEISTGEYGAALYVMSELVPDVTTGNVIDGSIGSGPVVGPVPEPVTALNIVLGCLGVGLLWRRRLHS